MASAAPRALFDSSSARARAELEQLAERRAELFAAAWQIDDIYYGKPIPRWSSTFPWWRRTPRGRWDSLMAEIHALGRRRRELTEKLVVIDRMRPA